MEKDKGSLQERAPGVPTGPGEGERGGGMFRGLDMQLTAEETEDFRGMGRGLQKRGPPCVVPPFRGVPGDAGGGPGGPGSDPGGGTGSHQNQPGPFSGPQNQQKENLNLTSKGQPGPTVGQLQAGEQEKKQVINSVDVHTLPLSDIPTNVRASMNKQSLLPLMPDSFKSMIYCFVLANLVISLNRMPILGKLIPK